MPGTLFTRRGLLLAEDGSEFAFVRHHAIAAWHAGLYDATRDALVDFVSDTHHARLGGSVGADANDPLLLPYSGEKYLSLPGTTGNSASAPAAAAHNILGDLDVRVQIAVPDWKPISVKSFINRWATGNQWNFALSPAAGPGPAGHLVFVWVSSGGTRTVRSTAAVPFANGTAGWVRATLDVDNGADGHTVVFYTSTDGVAWSVLATVVVAGVTDIASVAGTALRIGLRDGDQQTEGTVFRAQVRDGIDGTLAADFDPARSVEPHTTFTASTGEVWAIDRSATGRKSVLVDRPLLLFGTDDYLEVPDRAALDFGAGDGFTLAWVGRLHGTTANTALVAKKADLTTAAGYAIDRGTGGLTPRVMLADGANNPTATTPVVTAGQTTLAALVRAGGLTGFRNATAGTLVADNAGDLTNAEALRFGRLSGASEAYSDMEFVGAAVFRRALTDAELARVAREFGAS
jgi:hypothetical protein